MEIKEILNGFAQNGFDYISTHEEEEQLVKYIVENQENCPVPLYRGIMVDEDYTLEEGQNVDFENSFASFDEDEEKAVEFATRLGYGVVFTIEDAEGLPLYMHASTCHDEQEWLLLDAEYVVTSVGQDGNIIYATIKRSEES